MESRAYANLATYFLHPAPGSHDFESKNGRGGADWKNGEPSVQAWEGCLPLWNPISVSYVTRIIMNEINIRTLRERYGHSEPLAAVYSRFIVLVTSASTVQIYIYVDAIRVNAKNRCGCKAFLVSEVIIIMNSIVNMVSATP